MTVDSARNDDVSTWGVHAKPDSVGIRVLGVQLDLRCDHPELLDYVVRLAPNGASEPPDVPDVCVAGHWTTKRSKEPHEIFGTEGLEAFGKRMLLGDRELLWFRMPRDRDLQLRFRDGPRFDVVYCFDPSAKKLAQHPDLKYRKLFDVTRYLVTYPVVWVLERTRGWALLHAAAVATERGAVLIAGVGGSGKTTTALALAGLPGARLLSENLVLCDGTTIRPVREPLRLADDALDLLGDRAGDLEPLEIGGSNTKRLYQLGPYSEAEAVPVAAVFVPRFAPRGYVERIDSGAACEQLLATNRLSVEVDDYNAYRSALDLLWPRPGNARQQLEVFERLAASAPCHALGIERARGVGAVVEAVTSALG